MWCRAFRSVVTAAEKLQVGLYGRYSTDRVQKLAIYHQATSSRRAVMVIIATAIPCAITPILLDSVRLSDPYAGLRENGFFFVRLGVTWWIFCFIIAYQGRHFVSSISLTVRGTAVAASIASAGTTGISYIIATVVGFPLPFTIVVGAPFGVLLLWTTVSPTWLRRFRTQPEVWPQTASVLKVWMCQCCLTSIYAGYLYIFTSLPTSGQLPFACLLPVIKVLVRNWLSRALEHLKDEMSEHVLLNADVFSALFVAYCMQTVPSVWATAGLMAIDFAQIFSAIWDIKRFLGEAESLRAQLAAQDTGGLPNPSVLPPIDFSASRNVLELANDIITRHHGHSTILVRKKTTRNTDDEHQYALDMPTTSTPTYPLRKVLPIQAMARSNAQSCAPSPRSDRSPNAGRTRSVLESTVLALPPLERQYVDIVGRILFFAEFLLLLNFIEVVIPIVYSISLVATYFLPNRSYYPALAELDESEMGHTVATVLVYGLLELVSLVTLCWLLSWKLRISSATQLAFLLQQQWDGVQLKLVLWVLYASQTSLEHYGYDYSFQFPWLKHGTD